MGVRADVRVEGDGIFASALQAAFAHATTLPALLQVGLKLPPDALHALVRLRSLDRTAFEELWDRFVAMGADEDAPAPDGGPSARALLDEALEDEADRYEDTWE